VNNMSQLWSEINKVVNVVQPQAPSTTGAFDGTVNSDIVNMENYNKCTFVMILGATSTGTTAVTVKAGVDNSTCATACTFRYRTQISGTGGASGTTGSDTPSSLSTGVTTFTTTVSTPGGIYIVEVDASDVAAAITAGDHCKLVCTESANTPVSGCVLAVLSEPRYPQAILQTAID